MRFLAGETENDESLARRMAATCDVFVMDAFGTAHRAHASTAGVVRHAPASCAGPLLAAELDALGQALDRPARPVVAVVGGAKVAGKIELLENLAGKVDRLVVGGGIANTFLAAAGLPVGASLVDRERVPFAASLLARAVSGTGSFDVVLPSDVVVAQALAADADVAVKPAGEVGEADLILDIGPESAEHLARIVGEAGTIIWNGPVGVFECPPFAAGTARLAEAVAASPAFSIAGGGDTLAAIETFGVEAGLSRISTGGRGLPRVPGGPDASRRRRARGGAATDPMTWRPAEIEVSAWGHAVLRCGPDRWHAGTDTSRKRNGRTLSSLRCCDQAPIACGPGKWFAETEAAAWRWGEALDARFPGQVLVLELDVEIVGRAFRLGNLDGIGPAAYVEGGDLTRIRIVEGVEQTS